MRIHQFNTEKLAHMSYMLLGTKTCAIIDPDRYIDGYLKVAEDEKLEITHIFLTHLHADFISGHLELAGETGADIYAPAKANCAFAHKSLSAGDVLALDQMEIQVVETPGHSPEHINYVVRDTKRADVPVAVFTGDVLFVNDVGRPDIFPEKAQEYAAQLYSSIFEKLYMLPDYCEVYPAHSEGSLCGRALSAKRESTIGFEKRYNSATDALNKEEFVSRVLGTMPKAPDYFHRCPEVNRKGPALLASLPELEMLKPEDFMEMVKEDGSNVIDVRSYQAYGSQHLPNAWSLDPAGNIPVFGGWVLDPETEYLLVAEDKEAAENAVKWFRRAGVDKTRYAVQGGMSALNMAGVKTNNVETISIPEIGEMLAENRDIVILDVRSDAEYGRDHIDGALNIPVADLRERHNELDREKTYMLFCGSGARSSLGVSILEKNGFEKLINVAGGMTGYFANEASEKK